MKILFILLIIAFLISLFVIYMATRKIKNQDNESTELIREGSKMSNKLRLKEIEVDRLVRRIKKAENDLHIRIVGRGMIATEDTSKTKLLFTVIFVCRECISEMEVFRKNSFIKIVCPNCRHTKKLKILF